ncbi:outer membrane protein assembly factor BamE [Cupriavidus plantarum]|uniref:Outer membrane protein assembly factor BamE n=2 Tax=Cupriavidus plantarum TaxID=942865 RepID=A0A316EVB4_9BURK|nr:Beta-barrel assembly machine subunit BamE [Cupriavidus plantarum]REF02976.1 Beta-barrel assembly machine subunit BamE [Cupriavidus plantarum]RLK44159.1 Beta-barrel assembly machine subunit BamE [Cupriavidus plantarum]CAG2141765.1 Outer membrane protein assembly factor BamE [Cupriavidus plantarum]SMR65361.1 Beta-barrel assembly machine subunit BamE [Cupriavidus plantarum]
MRPTLVTSLLAATMLVGACSAYDSTSRKVANAITPYRINIVQGNFVSREAASQLREGMTRDQVRFLLGTPLLTDVFHGNRWDYVFSFRRGSTPVVQQRRYTVYFQDDKLVKFGGDELPSEYELIAEIDGFKAVQKNQTVTKILTGTNTDAPVGPKGAPAPPADAANPVPATEAPATAPAAPAAASPQASEAPAAAANGVVVKPVN